MRIAFLTEMGFEGKVPSNHPNARTEFAWMNALDADHYNIRAIDKVTNYDHVFIIFPKGEVYLNAFAVKLSDKQNPVSDILKYPLVEKLKASNKKVHYVQEGPLIMRYMIKYTSIILYLNVILYLLIMNTM